MSKHQHGWVFILMLPIVMVSWMMLMAYFEKLYFLKQDWLRWQQSTHLERGQFRRATLMDKNPCVLLCDKQCKTAYLWKLEFEYADYDVLRPEKENLCRQKNSLKIYHALVSWRFNPKL
jgi:hypothetical protein